MALSGKEWTCPVCGQSRLAPHFRIDDFLYVRCPGCGLILTRPTIPAGPGDDYDGIDLDRYRRFAELFLLPQYRRALRKIRVFKRGGRLLDIGCGTGEFLALAGELGYDGLGIEPSPTACRVAGQKNRVLCAEWSSVPLESRSFDIVTLWSVLEHTPDPRLFLEKVRDVLRPDGILALRVPLSDGLVPHVALWLYRVSGGRIRRPLAAVCQTEWHYVHFCLYNRSNLNQLLLTSGFEVTHHWKESSYDLRSLKYRMDYLPQNFGLQLVLKAAMGLLRVFAEALSRQDENVVLARRRT